MALLKYLKFRTSLARYEARTLFNIGKKSFKRMLGSSSIKRTQEFDSKGYNEEWKQWPSSMKTDAKPGITYVDGRLVLWRSIDRRRYVLKEVAGLLASIRPQSFAELGSGNGINLIALAIMCPWIPRWRGVEITETGVKKAKEFIKNPPYEPLMFITGESKDTIDKHLRSLDIDFIQSDMREIPVADRSLGCIFTHQAIERLPDEYMDAFKEARRVANHAIFVESFAEVQRSFVHWLYLLSSDYFRASFRDVEKAGFKVVRFEPIVAKAKHSSAILLCN